MPHYVRRVQTVLTNEQYHHLKQLAATNGKSLSGLIREAVAAVYCVPQEEAERRKALRELLNLKAPVADWEEMEAEILRGALG